MARTAREARSSSLGNAPLHMLVEDHNKIHAKI
jgi:hypothetical protein